MERVEPSWRAAVEMCAEVEFRIGSSRQLPDAELCLVIGMQPSILSHCTFLLAGPLTVMI